MHSWSSVLLTSQCAVRGTHVRLPGCSMPAWLYVRVISFDIFCTTLEARLDFYRSTPGLHPSTFDLQPRKTTAMIWNNTACKVFCMLIGIQTLLRKSQSNRDDHVRATTAIVRRIVRRSACSTSPYCSCCDSVTWQLGASELSGHASR